MLEFGQYILLNSNVEFVPEFHLSLVVRAPGLGLGKQLIDLRLQLLQDLSTVVVVGICAQYKFNHSSHERHLQNDNIWS